MNKTINLRLKSGEVVEAQVIPFSVRTTYNYCRGYDMEYGWVEGYNGRATYHVICYAIQSEDKYFWFYLSVKDWEEYKDNIIEKFENKTGHRNCKILWSKEDYWEE